MQKLICRACFTPLLQRYSLKNYISICLVSALALGWTRHSGCNVPLLPREAAAPAPPDSSSTVLWDRRCTPWVSLGWKLLQHLLRAIMSWDLLTEWGLGAGWPHTPCALLWGTVWSWYGERTHSGVKYLLQQCVFPCTDALLQASATMADKLAFAHLWDTDSSCTGLSFRQDFQRFYQNQETQLGSCPGYRWHQARILLLPSKNYFYITQKF